MSYHVALELNQEQVKKLRLLATNRDTTVKDLVSELVIKEIGIKKEDTKK